MLEKSPPLFTRPKLGLYLFETKRRRILARQPAIDGLNACNVAPTQILGIITLTLAFWQPVNAFVRPHPPAPGENKAVC
jgi:hypothetical protein